MSEILNRAGINAVLGAGSVVLNDYALNITPIERGYRLTVKRGSETQTMDILDGVGIVGVVKTGSTGDVDSYRVTFTDGSTFDYTVETNAAAHAAAEAARVEAENSRAGAEAARESAEAGRVNAEDARVEAEAARESAEAARASAESARAQAEDGRQSAEAARVAAEQSRASAESVRAAAENARVAAENARAEAENERAGAETLRSAAETDRATAESGRVSAEQGRVSAETERVTAETERAATFSGYQNEINAVEDDVAAITPDDSAVDGKPWTSKKIVDALCPPLNTSGNPVQCHPVAGYPLGVKVIWEPTQAGSGDPSPDNIRPITGRDAVQVTRCGENLLNIKPFNKFTKNGITFEYVPDGGIHMSGTATAIADSSVFPFWQLPPGKYYGIDSAKGVTSLVVQRNGKLWLINTKGIFEILAGDVVKYWYVSVGSDTTIDDTIYPYIVPGTTAPTAYEPYTGTTATLSLPSTVYGGEVDLATGEGVETWACLVLDGTERWEAYTNHVNNGFQYSLYTDVNLPLIEQGDNRVCTHFSTSNFKYWSQLVANNFATNEHYIRVQSLIPTLDEWKSYLAAQAAAGTPVQIAYKLAEPVPFTATGTQPIPALSGVNTLYTDSGDISVSGRTDMIWLTQSLIDRIAALETAAVSG